MKGGWKIDIDSGLAQSGIHHQQYRKWTTAVIADRYKGKGRDIITEELGGDHGNTATGFSMNEEWQKHVKSKYSGLNTPDRVTKDTPGSMFAHMGPQNNNNYLYYDTFSDYYNYYNNNPYINNNPHHSHQRRRRRKGRRHRNNFNFNSR
eukprot:243904_1